MPSLSKKDKDTFKKLGISKDDRIRDFDPSNLSKDEKEDAIKAARIRSGSLKVKERPVAPKVSGKLDALQKFKLGFEKIQDRGDKAKELIKKNLRRGPQGL